MAGAEAWKPTFNPWLIAIVVAMAAFMEVLDTSIANVALPHLAGDLGASNDESTWVLTSYLVSNAVVLPMTGWLATTFGRKRLFLLCISLFTLTSLLCGVAPSLSMLVLFRVIQGAGGGGLQPMAQAILADTFPPEKRGLAFALYGITTIMAPTIGPTLGGWLCLAFGMYRSTTQLDLLVSFGAASRLRIAQAFGLGFLFVPITLVAYIGIPPEKGNSVSGLVNFMRNIGSSVGTSLVTTLLARRAQFHQSMLSSHATTYDSAFRNQVNGLAAQLSHAGASVPDAQVQAYARAYQSLQIQSQTLAYLDTYMVLAVAASLMFVLSFVVRKNDPSARGQVATE